MLLPPDSYAMPEDTVPSWSGDPATFEAFATACRWYERGLKESERKLAASRIWQRLGGAAKSVVRHLNPEEFDTPSGLKKLLDILRASPLQQLPIPDSFSRLEKWTALRRGAHESIPQLLVREEDLFVELQQALTRARQDRTQTETTGTSTREAPMSDPAMSPTRSPTTAGRRVNFEDEDEEENAEKAEPKSETSPSSSTGYGTTGFFEDELRGYRLLQAARVSKAEKQHVLTLTRNSTRFIYVRRALRTLFSDDPQETFRERPRGTWWAAEDPWSPPVEDNPDDWWWYDQENYFGDDVAADYHYEDWAYDRDYATEEDGWDFSPAEPEVTDDVADTEEAKALESAYALAQTANKTLADARQAVAKVRAARGYFDPAGMKGSGKAFSGSSKGSKGGKGKGGPRPTGKGSRPSFGPCFICGSPNHGYANCPDRWSKGGGKPHGKGKTKKGKGKSGKKSSSSEKGSFYGSYDGYSDGYHYEFFVDLREYQDVNVLSLASDDEAFNRGAAKVIVDTGATESVSGVSSMARLLDSAEPPLHYEVNLVDRPRFRFGNGLSQQATSRIDLHTSAFGGMSFYLLDHEAEHTPPLVGGRELHGRKAVINYSDLTMIHENHVHPLRWLVSRLGMLKGKHLMLDLNAVPQNFVGIVSDGPPGAGPRRGPPGPTGGRGPPGPTGGKPSSGYGPTGDSEDDGSGGGHGGPRRGRRGHGPYRRDGASEDALDTVEESPAGEVSRSPESSPGYLPSVPEETEASPAHSPEATGEDVFSEFHGTDREDLSRGDASEKETDPDQPLQTRDENLEESGGLGYSFEQEVHEVLVLGVSGSYSGENQHEVLHEIHRRTAESAQELDRIRSILRANGHDADGHYYSEDSSAGNGSQAAGMALYGYARGWAAEEQQVCHLADVQQVRAAADVFGQGRGRGAQPFGGPSARARDGGPDRALVDLHAGEHEREDLPGQADGDQRKSDGGVQRRERAEFGHSGPLSSGTGSFGDGLVGGDGDSPPTGGRGEAQDGAEGEGQGYPDSLDPGVHYSDGGVRDHRGGGAGGLGGFWEQLKGLQQRIRGNAERRRLETVSAPVQVGQGSGLGPTYDTTMEPLAGSPKLGAERSASAGLVEQDILSVANAKEKRLLPGMAWKLARAAALTAFIVQPIQELFRVIENKYDLVEIACSPTSSLTTTFEKYGYDCLRVNYKTGFNLDTRKGTAALQETLRSTPTRLAWVSMSCTRLSSLQNLTPRNEEQWGAFVKKRGQDLRRSEEVVMALEHVLAGGGDVAWEWPSGATLGWKSKAIRRLESLLKRYGKGVFYARFDGCQYGLEFGGQPILKKWTVLTSSRGLWTALSRRCGGLCGEHVECRGPAAQASAYYPVPMCQAVVKTMRHEWDSAEALGGARHGAPGCGSRLSDGCVCPLSDPDPCQSGAHWATSRGGEADDDAGPSEFWPLGLLQLAATPRSAGIPSVGHRTGRHSPVSRVRGSGASASGTSCLDGQGPGALRGLGHGCLRVRGRGRQQEVQGCAVAGPGVGTGDAGRVAVL